MAATNPAFLVAAAKSVLTVIGRTLVGVGHPHVERHDRHLEPEADYEQQDRDHGDMGSRTGCAIALTTVDDLGAPCQTVAQADGIEDYGRGEGAEDRILRRGLVRLLPALVEPGQRVGREAHQLPGDEEHQQVGGVREEEHAEGREREERAVERAVRPGDIVGMETTATASVTERVTRAKRPPRAVGGEESPELASTGWGDDACSAPRRLAPRRGRATRR